VHDSNEQTQIFAAKVVLDETAAASEPPPTSPPSQEDLSANTTVETQLNDSSEKGIELVVSSTTKSSDSDLTRPVTGVQLSDIDDLYIQLMRFVDVHDKRVGIKCGMRRGLQFPKTGGDGDQ
jgi:hypothetical protein